MIGHASNYPSLAYSSDDDSNKCESQTSSETGDGSTSTATSNHSGSSSIPSRSSSKRLREDGLKDATATREMPRLKRSMTDLNHFISCRELHVSDDTRVRDLSESAGATSSSTSLPLTSEDFGNLADQCKKPKVARPGADIPRAPPSTPVSSSSKDIAGTAGVGNRGFDEVGAGPGAGGEWGHFVDCQDEQFDDNRWLEPLNVSELADPPDRVSDMSGMIGMMSVLGKLKRLCFNKDNAVSSSVKEIKRHEISASADDRPSASSEPAMHLASLAPREMSAHAAAAAAAMAGAGSAHAAAAAAAEAAASDGSSSTGSAAHVARGRARLTSYPPQGQRFPHYVVKRRSIISNRNPNIQRSGSDVNLDIPNLDSSSDGSSTYRSLSSTPDGRDTASAMTSVSTESIHALHNDWGPLPPNLSTRSSSCEPPGTLRSNAYLPVADSNPSNITPPLLHYYSKSTTSISKFCGTSTEKNIMKQLEIRRSQKAKPPAEDTSPNTIPH